MCDRGMSTTSFLGRDVLAIALLAVADLIALTPVLIAPGSPVAACRDGISFFLVWRRHFFHDVKTALLFIVTSDSVWHIVTLDTVWVWGRYFVARMSPELE
jgi:hypothetical protein